MKTRLYLYIITFIWLCFFMAFTSLAHATLYKDWFDDNMSENQEFSDYIDTQCDTSYIKFENSQFAPASWRGYEHPNRPTGPSYGPCSLYHESWTQPVCYFYNDGQPWGWSYARIQEPVQCIDLDPAEHDSDGDGVPDLYDFDPYDPEISIDPDLAGSEDGGLGADGGDSWARFTGTAYSSVSNPDHDPDDPFSPEWVRDKLIAAEISIYNNNYSYRRSQSYGDVNAESEGPIIYGSHDLPTADLPPDQYFPSDAVTNALTQIGGGSFDHTTVTTPHKSYDADTTPTPTTGTTGGIIIDGQEYSGDFTLDPGATVIDPETGDVLDYSAQLSALNQNLLAMANRKQIDYSGTVESIGSNIETVSKQLGDQYKETERINYNLDRLNKEFAKSSDQIGDGLQGVVTSIDGLGSGLGALLGSIDGRLEGMEGGEPGGDPGGDPDGDPYGLIDGVVGGMGEFFTGTGGQGFYDGIADAMGDGIGLTDSDQQDLDDDISDGDYQFGQNVTAIEDSSIIAEHDVPEEYQQRTNIPDRFLSYFANNPISDIIGQSSLTASGSPSASFNFHGHNVSITMEGVEYPLQLFGSILLMLVTFAGFVMVIRG